MADDTNEYNDHNDQVELDAQATADEIPTHMADGDDSADQSGNVDSTRIPPKALRQAVRNSLTPGKLIIHHPSRDISVPADGDAALRMIAWFAGRAPKHLLDDVNPFTSDAANGWTTIDVSTIVGLTWIPDANREPAGRVVFDPMMR